MKENEKIVRNIVLANSTGMVLGKGLPLHPLRGGAYIFFFFTYIFQKRVDGRSRWTFVLVSERRLFFDVLAQVFINLAHDVQATDLDPQNLTPMTENATVER